MQILIGGVYWVLDSTLDLVPGEGPRNLHPRRPVVVVSGPGTNSDPKWSHVLAVPTSTSTTLKTRFCVKIAAGEANMPQKTWVRVPAVQPLRKAALQDHLGVLPGPKLVEVQARLAEYMGFTDIDDDEPPF